MGSSMTFAEQQLRSSQPRRRSPPACSPTYEPVNTLPDATPHSGRSGTGVGGGLMSALLRRSEAEDDSAATATTCVMIAA